MNRQIITGQAVVAGVVGSPVHHSLSPTLHNAWITAAGLDAAYVPLPLPADGFATFLNAARHVLRGVNVTAPFKEEAFALADRRDDTARGCGSANLLLFEDGQIHARSTDGEGLLAALADVAAPAGPALVLGAGGAARAAAAAVAEAGRPVWVAARRAASAWGLATDIEGVAAVDWADLAGAVAEAALLINATSATQTVDLGLPWSTARPTAVALDMTYRPLRTRFLLDAEAAGLATIDGLDMLIGQARPSFEALFGRPPPELDVRALALRQLATEP